MNQSINRACACIGLLAALSGHAQVSLAYYDGFNYAAGGNLAGNGSWVASSGSGTVKVNGANLTYNGLSTSVGNDVSIIPTSSAARTSLNFTSQTSGTVYFSFLLRINTAPSAQRLIGYAYSTSSSSSTPYLGFFATTGGQLGVGISTSSPQFTSSGLLVGSTNLIVVAYTFGASDTAQVWINPTELGGIAPAVTGSFTASHNSSLAYFQWNTPSAGTGGGSYEVDEFRIGSSWSIVTPTGSVTPPSMNTPYITHVVRSPDGLIVQGTNGNAGQSYIVMSTTNIALPQWQWVAVATNTFETNGAFTCTNVIELPANGRFYRVYTGSTPPPQPTAPTITNQVQSPTVFLGQSASFTVVPSGTPPFTYQWYFNSSTLLAGRTNSTLTLNNVQTNDAGTYSVVVTSSFGSATGVVATVTVNTNVAAAGDLFPANGAFSVCVDTPFSITFSNTPTLGSSGFIRIYNANTLTLHDSIDLSSSTQTKKIGGATYNYKPVLISGKTAYILMHTNLQYGQSYYVTVDSAAFTGVGAWGGIVASNSWLFGTKASAPSAGATSVNVAADGNGDFCTVQGAIDSFPSGNTTPRTVNVQNGIYREIIFNNNRNNLRFVGQDRQQTIITYPNNENMNVGSQMRSMFNIAANDVIIQTMTLSNSTPQGGSQAEAVRVDGLRFMLWNCDLYSLQDTIMCNANGQQAYFKDSLVAGNVDYVWGSATMYFTNCEIRSIFRSGNPNGYICQPRNDGAHNGIAFVNCNLTGSGGSFTTQYLARNNKNDANPPSQTVFINCRMSTNIPAVGWLLDGSSSTAALRFWEYQTTDSSGVNLLDVSQRPSWSKQLTGPEADNVRDVAVWFSGWMPQIP